jgi:hypothetical protein
MTDRVRRGIPAVLMLLVAACGSGPPVQEMSDARQAIAVAREAGAEERAAEQLRDAEALLDRAQQRLSDRAYDEARNNALQAKLKALDALARAESTPRKDSPGVAGHRNEVPAVPCERPCAGCFLP